MKKLFIRVIPLLLCLCIMLTGMTACDKNRQPPPQKPDFAKVISNFEAETFKRGDLNGALTVTLYDASGDPISVVQSLKATRTQSEGYYLFDMEVSTSDCAGTILNLLGLAESFADMDVSDILDYLTGDIRGVAKLGYYNGIYNGKFDMLEADEEPDYIITDDNDRQFNAFVGIAESNISEYLGSLGYEGQELLSIKDFIMLLQLKEFNWASYTDEISKDLGSDNKFNYRITVPSADIRDTLFALADKYVADFTNSEDEDIEEFLQEYQERKTFLQGLMTFHPLIITAQVNRNGLIETLTHDFSVSIKISDQQILDQLEDSDEKDLIIDRLPAMHLFIGTSNKEENKTEITFGITSTETYTYGESATINVEDDIFASAVEEAEGRTLLGFVYDEQQQEYRLKKLSGPDYED